MGPGTGWVWYRYSHPATHPSPHYPGYTPPGTMLHATATGTAAAQPKEAVGLKSVAQLSLSARISGFLGMTEVYNLVKVGRINNHFVISQNE